MSSEELEIKDSCFTPRVRSLLGLLCVATKASPGKRDLGQSEETDQSPRCNGRQAMVKAGSLSLLFDGSLWRRRSQEGLQFGPGTGRREHYKRSWQKRPSPPAAGKGHRQEHALRCFKILLTLCSFPLFPDLQWKLLPKPCSSNTLGSKARKRRSQVPELIQAAEARASLGSCRQQQRGKLCRSDPEQKWPTISSTRNRGGWPGKGRQSPDPSLLLKTELFSRHMRHKDIAL